MEEYSKTLVDVLHDTEIHQQYDQKKFRTLANEVKNLTLRLDDSEQSIQSLKDTVQKEMETTRTLTLKLHQKSESISTLVKQLSEAYTVLQQQLREQNDKEGAEVQANLEDNVERQTFYKYTSEELKALSATSAAKLMPKNIPNKLLADQAYVRYNNFKSTLRTSVGLAELLTSLNTNNLVAVATQIQGLRINNYHAAAKAIESIFSQADSNPTQCKVYAQLTINMCGNNLLFKHKLIADCMILAELRFASNGNYGPYIEIEFQFFVEFFKAGLLSIDLTEQGQQLEQLNEPALNRYIAKLTASLSDEQNDSSTWLAIMDLMGFRQNGWKR